MDEGFPWYWLSLYAPVAEDVRLLSDHGWRIVGECEDYPIIMARKRFRWFGAAMLIEVSLDPSPDADGVRPVRIEGIGWVVRDEADVFGWFTWA